jgi:hypothetical protein
MSSPLITHNLCKYCHIRGSFVTNVISRWIIFVFYPEKRNFYGQKKKKKAHSKSSHNSVLRFGVRTGRVKWAGECHYFLYSSSKDCWHIRVVLILALWKLVTPIDATYITNKQKVPNLFTYNTWLPQYWQEQHRLLYSWCLSKRLYIDRTSTILML